MSQVRYLCDEDFRYPIIAAMRRIEPQIGIETVAQRGWAHRPDEDVLALAAAEGLAVVSHDVNTMTAAAYARVSQAERMNGLFVAAQTLPTRLIAENLVLIWSASEAEEWIGRVIFLPI